MKEIKIEKCPLCGGEDFIECQVAAYGGVFVTTGGFRNEAVWATVCRNCGSLVRTFCKNPEKLYPKKERKH